MPASFQANVSRTPAGAVPFVRGWQASARHVHGICMLLFEAYAWYNGTRSFVRGIYTWYMRGWQAARNGVLLRLRALGLACRDYRQVVSKLVCK